MPDALSGIRPNVNTTDGSGEYRTGGDLNMELTGMKQKLSHEDSGHRPGRCLEIINIRLYDPADRRKITELFQRMAGRYPDARFTLFRNAAVEGDWSIHIWRPPASREGAKSPEALCLFELLREIGLVHHGVWLPKPDLNQMDQDG